MAKDKPQPQTGIEIEEYSTTATPKAYAGSVPVFCAHDAIVPLKELRPNPKNPNQHPPEQIKLLASIIRATGWRAPITVSKRSGLVTKGHGRLMAAQLDDLTDAPVDYQDYASEAEELADLTADNRIAELAITYKGRLLTPVHFGMTPKAPPRGKSYTLKAQVLKGQKRVVGRYLNTRTPGGPFSQRSHNILMGTGNTKGDGTSWIPFQRMSRNRTNIKKLTTVSVPQMITSDRTNDAIMLRLNTETSKRLEHHMKRALGL